MDIFIRGNYEEETSPSGTHKKIRINEDQIERVDIDSFYDLSEKINEESFDEFEIFNIVNDWGKEEQLKFIKDILSQNSWNLGELELKALMIDIFDLIADELSEILEVDIKNAKENI